MDPADTPDLVLDYQKHLDEGRVWKVRVKLPMDDDQIVPGQEELSSEELAEIDK